MQTLLYFLLFGALFFVMMRFGCGAHVMGHGHGGHRHGGSSSHGDDASGASLPPDEAKDPVCGMTVKTAGAKSSVYQGRSYFFCSSACRDKFEASPAQYATAAPAVAHKEHRHGCC